MSSIPTAGSAAETPVTAESGHTLDLDRHAGNDIPTKGVPRPKLGSNFKLDAGVVEGALYYLWGNGRCRVFVLTQLEPE